MLKIFHSCLMIQYRQIVKFLLNTTMQGQFRGETEKKMNIEWKFEGDIGVKSDQ